MKKIFMALVFCALFSAPEILAQDPYADIFSTQLPSVVPTSPEATEFVRFGNNTINPSTGKMSFSIPVFDIKTIDGSFPISLNYDYNGLILDAPPSLAGLGWNLGAGGAVIREIRGLPDEHEDGYYGVNGRRQVLDDYLDNGAISLFDIRNFFDNKWDSDPDKYTVSFMGMYFSFKIDKNNQPYYLSRHNNKVKINFNSAYTNHVDSFEVTDANGTKYLFSEQEVIIPDLGEEFTPHTITSWKIKKITYPTNEQISFTYITNNFENFTYRAQGRVMKTQPEDLNSQAQWVLGAYNEYPNSSIINRKLLSGINFRYGLIDLLYDTSGPVTLLTDIKVINSNNVIHDYSLSYSGNRNLLKTVTYNSKTWYQFDYHGEPGDAVTIPDFYDSQDEFPRAQDFWKYYNGAPNQSALNVPGTIHNANKEPSFLHTRLGAMKKVYYPTGGVTEITYEQNQIKTENIADSDYYGNLPLNKTIYIRMETDNDPVKPDYKERFETHTFTEPTVATISHLVTGKVRTSNLILEITRDDACPYSQYYPSDFVLPYQPFLDYDEIADEFRDQIQQYKEAEPTANLNSEIPYLCPGLYEEFGPEDTRLEYDTRRGSSRGRILIMPGTYTFKIHTNFNRISDAYGEIVVRFHKPTSTTIGTYAPAFVNKNVGGVRVSEITDCPVDGDPNSCQSSYYSYDDEDGLSTAILNHIPSPAETHIMEVTNGGNTFIEEVYIFYLSHSLGLDPSYGTPVYYRTIENYNDPEKKQGFTQTTYYPPTDIPVQEWPPVPKGVDLTKERVKEENVYEYSLGQPFLEKSNKKTQYNQYRNFLASGTQLDENEDHPVGFVFALRKNLKVDFDSFDYGVNPVVNSPSYFAQLKLYTIVPFTDLDSRFLKKQDIIEETFENQNKVVQQIDYTYDTYLQSKTVKTTDSENDQVEKRFFYPYDMSDDTSQEMMIKNQLSNVVKTESFKNGNLIATKEIGYTKATDKFLPGIIKTSLSGAPTEPKIKLSYYLNGNLKEARQLNANDANGDSNSSGPITTYFWGYSNQHPIVKIQNASFAEVATVLGTSENSLQFYSDNNLPELESLRSLLPEAMVSTYTYLPMIGMQSSKDPSGYTTFYKYDDFNRLKSILDDEQYLLQEYFYHFKGEPITHTGFTIEDIQGPSLVPVDQSGTFNLNVVRGSGNYSYEWQFQKPDGSLSQTYSGTSITITFDSSFLLNNASTIIKCKVTDLFTGLERNAQSSFIVYEELTVTNVNTLNNWALTDQSTNFSVTANGGSGSYTYTWDFKRNGESIGTASGSSINKIFDQEDNGVVEVICTVYDTQLNTGTTASKTINVYTPVSQLAVNGNNLVHAGQNVLLYATGQGGSGNYNYNWQFSTTGAQTDYLDRPGINVIFSGSQVGTVTVTSTLTDVITGDPDIATKDITVYTALDVGAISETVTPNSGGYGSYQFSVNPSGGSGGYSYAWYVDNQLQPTATTNAFAHQINCYQTKSVKCEITDQTTGYTTSVSEDFYFNDPSICDLPQF
ncbi:hypothetical protein ACJD0Z_03980 [Flavobacteriaceae bacterium M23B6Z8]